MRLETGGARLENAGVIENLARTSQENRNWEESISYWRHLRILEPDAFRFYLGLGGVLLAAGEYIRGTGLNLDTAAEYFLEARRVFAAAATSFPDNFQVKLAFADALTRLQDWPNALERWQELTKRFPDDAAGHAGHGRALRESGDLDASASLLNEALARFPDDFETRIQLALTMSDKRDWPSALAQWERLKRLHPGHGAVRWHLQDILWKAQQDQGILRDGPLAFSIPPLLLAADGEPDAPSNPLTTLFMRFESIGTGCEFGLIQRRHYAEPLGLLRWAAIDPPKLIDALKNRFGGVGEPEQTITRVEHGEYVTEDRRYGIISHTFTRASLEGFELFSAMQCRRIQFLRRKLITDFENAEKIFLYKAHDGISDDEILALHAAMQQYSLRVNLFCLRLADVKHPHGSLERLDNHLFVGYATAFTTIDPPDDHWISLCRRVADAVDGRD